MIFTIGAVAYIVGLFIYRFYVGMWETTLGEKVGIFLMLAGFVAMLTSILTLAWKYLP